jgi:hypothetical protein
VVVVTPGAFQKGRSVEEQHPDIPFDHDDQLKTQSPLSASRASSLAPWGLAGEKTRTRCTKIRPVANSIPMFHPAGSAVAGGNYEDVPCILWKRIL